MSATPEVDGGGEESNDDDEVEVASTSYDETGVDPDGYFDGVETDDGGDDVAGLFDGTEDATDDEESPDPASTKTSGLAGDINAGVARAAVIGLDDEWTTDSGEEQSKDDLESEFKETFEAFRLGHYAQECAEEYLLVDEDIHPVWGLIGASLICAAVIVYKRPDGDQILDNAKTNLGDINVPKPNIAQSEDDTNDE
jgi:hypothetical protein